MGECAGEIYGNGTSSTTSSATDDDNNDIEDVSATDLPVSSTTSTVVDKHKTTIALDKVNAIVSPNTASKTSTVIELNANFTSDKTR